MNKTVQSEKIEKWAADEPGFMGTIRQLLDCAKCGKTLPGGKNTPQKTFNLFKPSLHFLCNNCWESLPDD